MRLTFNLVQQYYKNDSVCHTDRGIEVKQPSLLGNNIILVFPEGKEVDEDYLKYSFYADARLTETEQTFGINCHGCNPSVYTGKFVGCANKAYYVEPLSPDDESVNVAIISIMALDPDTAKMFTAPKDAIDSWQLLWSETMTVVYFLPITVQQRPKMAEWFMERCQEQKADDQAKA